MLKKINSQRRLSDKGILIIAGIFVFAAGLAFTFNFAQGQHQGGGIFRINNNSSYDIERHNQCRRVSNSSGGHILVPTGTANEWTDFRNNRPSGVSLSAPYCGSWSSWSSWSCGSWSSCSVSCGGGTQTRTCTRTRTRTCTDSTCNKTTETQTQSDTQSQSCNTDSCCTVGAVCLSYWHDHESNYCVGDSPPSPHYYDSCAPRPGVPGTVGPGKTCRHIHVYTYDSSCSCVFSGYQSKEEHFQEGACIN